MTDLQKEILKQNKKMERKLFWDGVKRKAQNALQWCVDNKELVVIAATGIGVAAKFGKKIAGNVKVSREQHYKDTHVYDHSTGAYVQLRHKLSQNEWKEVQNLKQTGKSTTQAMLELGLIK